MSEFIRKEVKLTPEIVEFFAHIHEMIVTEDDAALTVSDDLLQAERIYGGLRDPDNGVYDFVWFPESEVQERWEFSLLADEIDEIGSGYRDTLRVKAYKK
ncbi:MAG: hypothetical protein KDA84_05185 [Planctomycetaceae bacterium]|nr:hypothetical protein [Planctomycetaceae bacterium]